jgi:hypothetical protein
MGLVSEPPESPIENIPIVRNIRSRINELSSIETNVRTEREVLTHLHDHIITAFRGEEAKPPAEKPPVEKQKYESDETFPVENPETTKGTSSQKIDAEPSDDEPVAPCLRVLEDGAKAVVKILKNAPMTSRFKKVGRMCLSLETSLKINPGHNEIQRAARLELAMREALDFLQTSKLAIRFGDLKEARKIIEEALAKKSQVHP